MGQGFHIKRQKARRESDIKKNVEKTSSGGSDFCLDALQGQKKPTGVKSLIIQHIMELSGGENENIKNTISALSKNKLLALFDKPKPK